MKPKTTKEKLQELFGEIKPSRFIESAKQKYQKDMYKLIKITNDHYVVVDDSEIKVGDWFLPISGIGWELNKPKQADSSGGYNNNHCKKIIAGIPELPSIDFSGLTEEECTRIGIDNFSHVFEAVLTESGKKVWKFNYRDSDGLNQHSGIYFSEKYAVKGFNDFKTAQSLNGKKFSEDDLKLFAIELIAKYKLGQLEDFTEVNKIIKSYSQPKVFDVELELKEYGTIAKDFKDVNFKPKITNNSIKIIKVL